MNKTMTYAERKQKLKDALSYLGNAQENIDSHLQPVSHISNNFYEELVEHFTFVVSELDRRDKALKLMLNAFSSADLVWHQRKAVAEALEALGQCFVCRNTETCPDCGASLVDIGLGD